MYHGCLKIPGVIVVETAGIDPDEFSLYAIDAGAKDVKEDKGVLEIYTEPHDFETVKLAIEKRKSPFQQKLP